MRWLSLCAVMVMLASCGTKETKQGDVGTDTLVEISAGDVGDLAEAEAVDLLAELPDDVASDVCQPLCEDRNCGADGCGGNCGTCGALQVCLDGVCCSSNCSGRDCGPDGCGRSCGVCGEDAVCLDGVCCVAACGVHDCGPDGCGGTCGSCPAGMFCMMGFCSDPDTDVDGVPDHSDLFPQNPNLPGVALKETVYAHTADTLFSMDVKLYQLSEIGDFQWPNDGKTHKMTDIALDAYGVLYGTSYEYLYTCHPQTAECHFVADLPDAFNALTLVPAAYMGTERDVLVGISEGGDWYRLELTDGQIVPEKLGSYGAGYSSSGDSYSIFGVGTYAAVHKAGSSSNWLVSVDPVDGSVIEDIGPITGYTGIFGLAGWTQRAFAFDKTGAVLVIKTDTAEVQVLHTTTHKWWGAGVVTRL